MQKEVIKAIIEWLPYIGIAIIPGIVNIIAAWQELDEQCRCLPFFKPHKSWGFWLWLLFQFTAPILLFLGINPLKSKPAIDLTLIFKSIAIGISFLAVLNANTVMGNLSFGLKPVYDYFVHIAFDLITKEQNGRTTNFWHDVKEELNQSGANLIAGLNYLETYLEISLHRKPQELQKKLNKLEQARGKTSLAEQVKEIKSLIETNVRRNDLPDTLKNFGCSQELLNEYFNEKNENAEIE